MKKSLVCAVLVTLYGIGSSSGQSGWNKLLSGNKKKEEPKKEEKKILSPAELASADSAHPFLNDKEITKDSRGVSGIYYSLQPILVYKLQGGGTAWVKKFLINYVEGPKRHDIFINTQFAYETTDGSKFVKRANFWMNDYEIKIEKNGGFIATWEDDNVDNSKYEFYTHMESKDLQGNSIFGNDYLEDFNGALVEAEPGIFFIGNILADDTKPANLERNKKYKVLVVMARADKIQEATTKYASNAAVWEKLAEVMKRYDAALKVQTTNATTMPAPKTGFKDAPSTTTLNKAAQAFLDKYQGGDKLDYVYASSDWTKVYKSIGPLMQNTLVARELKAVLVATRNGECRVDFVSVRQDNTYVTGALTENFGSNALYIPASSVVNTIDCAKARQYKK